MRSEDEIKRDILRKMLNRIFPKEKICKTDSGLIYRGKRNIGYLGGIATMLAGNVTTFNTVGKGFTVFYSGIFPPLLLENNTKLLRRYFSEAIGIKISLVQ